MKNIKDFNLKENPFQYLTASPEYVTISNQEWYGLPQLKGKLTEVYNDLIQYEPRQLVLNWGPYGGGKTFAAYHFLQYSPEEANLHQVYVRSPKKGNRSEIEFYKSIINFLSYRKIKKQIQQLISLMGEDELFEFLRVRIRSEELTEAIILIGTGDFDQSRIMQRYIYEGLTKTELKQIGLAKNIDWGTDSMSFLAGIIHCFVGDQNRYKGKVVLWIDEMEDMIYYSQKDYRVFSQVLRDLMDSLNQHFCVFMNFTLAESEESTIGILLGEALWSRITKKIRFKELTMDDALLYCQEAITHQQINKTRGLAPFSKDLFVEILSLIPPENLTPREINRICGGVLKFAQRKEYNTISIDVVSEYVETE